jgi:hypothetical protein
VADSTGKQLELVIVELALRKRSKIARRWENETLANLDHDLTAFRILPVCVYELESPSAAFSVVVDIVSDLSVT